MRQQHYLLLQIKNIILKNIGNLELNIHDIAEHFKISSRYLSKLFQQEELTFVRFVLESRLKHSYRMLKSHMYQQSIKEITYQTGFQDMSYFIWEFKKYYGIQKIGEKYRIRPYYQRVAFSAFYPSIKVRSLYFHLHCLTAFDQF